MPFSETEKTMWADQSPKRDQKKQTKEKNDKEINNRYEDEKQQILLKINREKLPNLVQAINENAIDINPSYQRRPRWNDQKKSKLIESLIINIPIPPVLLYEKAYHSYEVIDGQQRLTTIRDFYQNKFSLEGLELWTELNGRTYEKLPYKIQDGLNQSLLFSIAIVMDADLDPLSLKQIAFERLNTGGVKLSNQEIRNCLYAGTFNDALIELSENSIFSAAWKNNQNPEENSSIYQKMEDVELVLRFFAFRHIENFTNNIRDFLNNYMIKSLQFTEQDIKFLKNLFNNTIKLADQIYGDKLFKPYIFNTKTQNWEWAANSYKDYYDAMMVGLSHHIAQKDILRERKQQVIEATQELLKEDDAKIFTGKGGSKTAIQERINQFDRMLSQVLA